jgi:hypothetical protein
VRTKYLNTICEKDTDLLYRETQMLLTLTDGFRVLAGDKVGRFYLNAGSECRTAFSPTLNLA